MINISKYNNKYFLMMILVTGVLIAHFNTFSNKLIWDDINTIVKNTNIHRLENIPSLLVSEDSIDVPTGYYRPITYVSFALDYYLWGLNPVGYNITNILLHVLIVVLFYRLVAAVFKREDLAFISAIIFALHPITCETINFHSGGRNTLLCGVFSILSFLLFVKKKTMPSVFFLLLAIFSKEFALLLPIIFLLYNKYISNNKIKWSYLLYVLSIIFYFVMRAYSVKKYSNPIKAIDTNAVYVIPEIIITYLKNMIYPLSLKSLYDIDYKVTLHSLSLYTIALILLVLSAYIFRKKREISSSIIIFILFLLPVTNLFPLGASMMSDRYAYFSLFGFSIALAYLICLAGKNVKLILTIAIILFFIPLDISRNAIWKDDISLFTHMIKDSPNMHFGYECLGYVYFDKQDYKNADKYLKLSMDKNCFGSV